MLEETFNIWTNFFDLQDWQRVIKTLLKYLPGQRENLFPHGAGNHWQILTTSSAPWGNH